MHICIDTISRRAGQQGPTRTLTAALKRVIKQLLGTNSIKQVKYYTTRHDTRQFCRVGSGHSGGVNDPLSRFCRIHGRNRQHTDTQT